MKNIILMFALCVGMPPFFIYFYLHFYVQILKNIFYS